jgi:hypothetical protein
LPQLGREEFEKFRESLPPDGERSVWRSSQMAEPSALLKSDPAALT